MSYVDPSGLAQFGYRPLDSVGFVPPLGTNPVDNATNTEWVHENIWFDDAEKNPGLPDNAGFFGDSGNFNEPGFVRPDYGHTRDDYAMCPGSYDDALMRKALENLRRWDRSNYNLAYRNCQDFADALRAEYFRLGGTIQ